MLVVLDGWGISAEPSGNAISNAATPNMDAFMKYYPNTILQASGIAAGLPWGKMGNSEVGHLILGAGKTLYQNLPRVSLSIQDKTFYSNDVLLNSIAHSIDNNSNIHIMGLLSDGGVHSHIDHLYAILEMLKMNRVASEKVFIHIFTDGRDTETTAGLKYLSELNRNIKEENWPGHIASIMGRYYAMDRNQTWDRTKLAYYCLANLVGVKELDPKLALEKSYAENVTDEFIKPTIFPDKFNNFTPIKENDSIIFYNIREDRARQLTKAFALDEFTSFDRGAKIENLYIATMMEYEKGLPVNVVFPPEIVANPLGKVISDNGLRQLRIAETEKYAHVTYFFNGGKESPFENEYRTLVPSPSVSTYDQTPEMSADTLTETAVKDIDSGRFDFILLNYANADMVGHTGNFKQAVKAIEFIDVCMGRIYEACMRNDFTLLITADHGNAEEMFNPKTGEIMTEHTTNPVPFIAISKDNKFPTPRKYDIDMRVGGMLSDVAPTVLDVMGLAKPEEMTGRSILDNLPTE